MGSAKKPCSYAEKWGCPRGAVVRDMSLSHAVLFAWLVDGPGTTIDRIREHDRVAGIEDLESVLRSELWDGRLRVIAGGL